LDAILSLLAARGDAEAASAYGRRQHQGTGTPVGGERVASLVNVMATSSSVADSNERSETGRAVPLFKAALRKMPQMDSIYAGFDNGAWLQVRCISDLSEEQRERPGAARRRLRSVCCPTPAGDLPMRRVFRTSRATKSVKSICGNTDTTPPASGPGTGKRFGQTGRMCRRPISRSARRAGDHGQRAVARQGAGVLPDLKLDTFSEFVQAQRRASMARS
jgi:adenylate cyclase